MTYDPDERFTLPEDDPEDALRRLMGIRGNPADMEPEEQVEDETEV
jgi:hypothetical protein